MGRKPGTVSCSKLDRKRLWELSRDASQPRIALRAQLVLQCVDGKRIKDIAAEYSERPNPLKTTSPYQLSFDKALSGY